MNLRLVVPVAVIAVFLAVVLVAFLAAEGFSAAVAILVVVFALVAFVIVDGQVRRASPGPVTRAPPTGLRPAGPSPRSTRLGSGERSPFGRLCGHEPLSRSGGGAADDAPG